MAFDVIQTDTQKIKRGKKEKNMKVKKLNALDMTLDD